MSVSGMTERLEVLASATSGLRRSRAMAQLWSEIRKSDREERRQFAHVLAERFAPALATRFEEVTGVDGPDFIKLVRSLIDADGGEVRALAVDLAQLQDDPTRPMDDITLQEVIDTTRAIGTREGRDALVTEAIDGLSARLTEEEAPAPMEPAAPTRPAAPTETTPSEAIADVASRSGDSAVDEVVDVEEPARRRDRRPDERARSKVSPSPVARTVERLPVSQLHDEPTPSSAPVAGEWLETIPSGWRRRRALSAVIRDGEISVADALALMRFLEGESDRRWILGDLIDRELSPSEQELLAARELPETLRHRFEAVHGGG